MIGLGSLLGKKLVAQCKGLREENAMLGDYIANGRVQQLEMEVHMRRKQAEELQHQLRGMWFTCLWLYN